MFAGLDIEDRRSLNGLLERLKGALRYELQDRDGSDGE